MHLGMSTGKLIKKKYIWIHYPDQQMHYIHINKILYIVSTATCFDASALSSGSLNLEFCYLYGFFVYHIPSCSFGSFSFIIVYMVVCFVYFCLILYVMYFYWYFYVFLLLCMFCSVYSVFIVPTDTFRLPWLRFSSAFSSVVRQMPGYNSQRRGTARTPSN
jgi:hypothetical protein